MATYTQIYYHIVFSTKNRVPVLEKDRREDLFRYIWGILKNKHCHTYRINGVEDHLHIFSSLHPTVRLADLVKEIKISSNDWIKSKGVIQCFPNWQVGYRAFTKSHPDRDSVIDYVKGQEEHHRKVSFLEEYKRLLKEAGIAFNEKYLL